MAFNWNVFIAFLIGLGIGATIVLFWMEWLDATAENKRRRLELHDEDERTLRDEPMKPLDAHHPAVMRDAQRRRAQVQARIRKELDELHKRGKQ